MGFLASLGNSRFLKKEDASPKPLLLTITSAGQENVAMEGEREKIKTILYFKETDKGFVLGKTTGEQIASFLGDPGDTPDRWFGKQIVLYCDPNVMMKGKLVGGLRVRQPRIPQGQTANPAWPQPAQAAAQPQTSAPQPPPEDDDIPF